MFVTSHVLAGAALGAGTRRPVPALVLGVLSHLALDAVPHWGGVSGGAFLAVAVADGLLGLAVLAVLARRLPRGVRLPVLAGAAGAALPDLDKPARLLLGVDLFPAAVDRLHAAVQTEAPGFWWVEVLVAVAVASGLVALLRRAASRERAET